jgi:hypothetical protein
MHKTVETSEESILSYDLFWVGTLVSDNGDTDGRNVKKVGWLFRLVKHAMWVDCLYFLYLLLLSIPSILASSQLTL